MESTLQGTKIWNYMLGYMDPTHTGELADGTYLDVVLFIPDDPPMSLQLETPNYDAPGTVCAFCSLLVEDGRAHMVGAEYVEDHQVIHILELPPNGGFFVRGSDYRRAVLSTELSNTVLEEARMFGVDLDLSEDINRALDGIHPTLPPMHLQGLHMKPIRAQDALFKAATLTMSSGR